MCIYVVLFALDWIYVQNVILGSLFVPGIWDHALVSIRFLTNGSRPSCQGAWYSKWWRSCLWDWLWSPRFTAARVRIHVVMSPPYKKMHIMFFSLRLEVIFNWRHRDIVCNMVYWMHGGCSALLWYIYYISKNAILYDLIYDLVVWRLD